MRKSQGTVRPTTVHIIAGRPFREFTIDGQPWYPIHDLIPILETTRNATQITRSLPSFMTTRLQITKRPATNMINGLGIIELIQRTDPERITNRFERVYHLARWAKSYLKSKKLSESQKIMTELKALEGDLTNLRVQMDRRTETMEALISRLDTLNKPRNPSP